MSILNEVQNGCTRSRIRIEKYGQITERMAQYFYGLLCVKYHAMVLHSEFSSFLCIKLNIKIFLRKDLTIFQDFFASSNLSALTV